MIINKMTICGSTNTTTGEKCKHKTDVRTSGTSCHLKKHQEKSFLSPGAGAEKEKTYPDESDSDSEDKKIRPRITLIDEYLRSTRLLQENVKRSMTENKIDPCALGLPDLQLTKVFSSKEKDTASESIICEGILHDDNVFIKISFVPKGMRKRDQNGKTQIIDGFSINNSLEIESRIYEEVVPILAKHTPNIMPFLANVTCQTFEASLKSLRHSHADIIRQEMKGLRTNYNMSRAKILITKKAKGRKLQDWLQSDEVPQQGKQLQSFIKDILFQIAYTLLVFEDLGLMHNDLHAGNVFVEKLERPLHLAFNVGTQTIVRDVHYFVQIYDFDRSAKVRTKYNDLVLRNTYLDSEFCETYGECNDFRRHADWFNVLQSLYRKRGDKYTNRRRVPIVGNLVENKLLDGSHQGDPLVLEGHACTCPKEKKSTKCEICKQINLDNDDLIKYSPEAYLKKFHVTDFSKEKSMFSRPAIK
jgi:hypothetical protein